MSLVSGGLFSHLLNVWTWADLHDGLRKSMLQLLITVSANCQEGKLCEGDLGFPGVFSISLPRGYVL